MAMMLILRLSLVAAPNTSLASEMANDVICGPRCVKRVLEHYGRASELIDLVRDLQGATIDRPANFLDMKRALERHGLYAVGVSLAPSNLPWLDWAEPVIVHIGEAGPRMGHFQVILPAGAQEEWIHVWDGLAPDAWISRRELSSTASGTVLLTSTSPIAEDAKFVRRPWYVDSGAYAYLLFAVCVLYAVWRRPFVACFLFRRIKR